MATIKIKRNKSDAFAKPTSLQEGELAVNLLDKSLFSGNGSTVVKLYTGEDKYFNEDGFANKALDATKLGGQLPSYYATATALEALREEIGGGGADTSNLATKEELAECEEVAAAALNELNDRVNELSENASGTTVTKEELAEAVGAINATIIENEEIAAAALNELNERVIGVGDRITEKFATKIELQDEVDTLIGIIQENEEVTAAALNELNDKITEILTRLNIKGI